MAPVLLVLIFVVFLMCGCLLFFRLTSFLVPFPTIVVFSLLFRFQTLFHLVLLSGSPIPLFCRSRHTFT